MERPLTVASRAAIEFLMLANHAEAVNGLLYISGGGWTDHRRPVTPGQPPLASRLAVAISVLIPWNETNQPHTLAIQLENQDATVVLSRTHVVLNVGRPPSLSPGSEQHAGLALLIDTHFPAAGEYCVVADLDDAQDVRRWSFRVHDVPQPAVPPPPAS